MQMQFLLAHRDCHLRPPSLGSNGGGLLGSGRDRRTQAGDEPGRRPRGSSQHGSAIQTPVARGADAHGRLATTSWLLRIPDTAGEFGTGLRTGPDGRSDPHTRASVRPLGPPVYLDPTTRNSPAVSFLVKGGFGPQAVGVARPSLPQRLDGFT